MFVRSPYNYDRRQASLACALECPEGSSRTIQSQKEESDINVIVKRFGITGHVPVNVRVPLQEDFDGVFDFQSAMNMVRGAQESFMEMPADIRSEFANDPGRFVDFCSARGEDGKLLNLERMRKMGLAIPESSVIESPPMKVEVVNKSA